MKGGCVRVTGVDDRRALLGKFVALPALSQRDFGLTQTFPRMDLAELGGMPSEGFLVACVRAQQIGDIFLRLVEVAASRVEFALSRSQTSFRSQLASNGRQRGPLQLLRLAFTIARASAARSGSAVFTIATGMLKPSQCASHPDIARQNPLRHPTSAWDRRTVSAAVGLGRTGAIAVCLAR